MTQQARSETVTRKVIEFYDALPFNLDQTVHEACRTIQETNLIKDTYPPLDAVLKRLTNACVLDIGCGTGWFANSVAYHYGVGVIGIDLCEPALERAYEVSQAVALTPRVRYQCADLFALHTVPSIRDRRFDLVNSLGVLHHTPDCYRAFLSIAQFVEEEGFIHLGLYHAYGRKPFLELFQPSREAFMAASDESSRRAAEEQAFRLFQALNPSMRDGALLRSWFRDQVLHPHESHHTFQEIYAWLTEAGFQCLATSINRFQAVRDWRVLFEEEQKMAALSYQRNYEEQRYFPGFFVVLAQKKPGRTRGTHGD